MTVNPPVVDAFGALVHNIGNIVVIVGMTLAVVFLLVGIVGICLVLARKLRDSDPGLQS